MNLIHHHVLIPSPPALICKLHPLRATSPTQSPSPSPPTALIIGAGLSGLSAALHLHSRSTPFLLLDSSDAVGGRVRTDALDGFLLDRGFQIFLTAYPTAQSLLHYPSLRLRPFYSGALIFYNNQFHRVADPFRHPIDSLASLPNPIGTVPDKLSVLVTRLRSAIRTDSEILNGHEMEIIDLLRSDGFSDSMIDRFFKPFLGGIFFDKELKTTSRLYEFVIKCLALGDNALPADGIGAIPNQIVSKLPTDSIRLNTKVVGIDYRTGAAPSATLESGEVLTAERGLIVAVDQPEAKRLLPDLDVKTGKSCRSTVCLYFSADRACVEDPILILNGSGEGLVNNMFFATNVAPSYAPEGKVLVSVSLIGSCYGEWSDEGLAARVVGELEGWFGEEVREWRHLRSYRIGFAQPDQTPPTELVGRDPRVGGGVYVCGDYRSSATFDGALLSGKMAAEALILDRQKL